MAQYDYVKIKGVQRQKHIHVWEEANGPLPDGYGHNNDLSNLVATTRGDHSAPHHKLRREGRLA